jgi:hypothetical protein
VAIVLPKLSSRRLSVRSKLTARAEPALGFRLLNLQPALLPGERLEFEYSIQRVSAQLIDRIEVSVVWITEGKGSEDIGVHYFESHSRAELVKKPLHQARIVATDLPNAPLSFNGKLFRIRWYVRLRLFLANGREISAEQPFYLGAVTNEI